MGENWVQTFKTADTAGWADSADNFFFDQILPPVGAQPLAKIVDHTVAKWLRTNTRKMSQYINLAFSAATDNL